jgi:hypothetical protein
MANTKIINKDDGRDCHMADISIGDIFEFEGEFYIKTEVVGQVPLANVVNIKDGKLGFFYSNTLIQRIKNVDIIITRN